MVKWAQSKDLLQNIDRFPEFCERFLKIQPIQGGRVVPFRLNKVQAWFFKTYVRPTWLANNPLRIAILKARQEGFSTFCQAFNFWCTLGRHNLSNLTIGRDEEQSLTLFRMIQRFDGNLEIGGDLPCFPKAICTKRQIEYRRPPLGKFPKKMVGRDDLVFLDSRIEIKSAMKDENLGRGGTYHVIHASEVAFWKNLISSLSALLACCHDEPKTAVFLESTACGYNAWHSFWTNLVIGEQEVPTDWQRVFVPWYWHGAYELPLTIKRFFLDEAEEELYQRIRNDPTAYEMDPDLCEDRIWAKIFWRRKVIRDKFFGDAMQFRQEFPATDLEAFVFNGVSAFSMTALTKMEKQVTNPLFRAHVRLVPPKEPGVEKDPKEPKPGRAHPSCQLEEHERGRLSLYEAPQPKAKYVAFGDSAEGKAAESFGSADEQKSKYDYSAVAVLRVDEYPVKPIKLVAMWHGTVDPDLFGDILVALGWYFNEAYLGWEINGPGRSLNMQIIEKWRYSNVYMREDMDAFTHRQTQKPGWRTTPGTKPDMVAMGQRYVREQGIWIPDAPTQMEMKAFSRVGQNKFEAAEGHDDRVIAVLGALIVVDPRLDVIRRQIEAEKKKELKVKESSDPERDMWEPKEKGHPILGSEW